MEEVPMTAAPTTLSDGHTATECPRWHEGELYFADMFADRVYAVREDGTRRVVAEVPGRPAGLGWLPDGTLLVVAQHDRVVHRVGADGSLAVYADLTGTSTSHLNDMWVLPDGRAFVGEMGFDIHEFHARIARGEDPMEVFAPGRVHVVHPDGSSAVAAEGLLFPNGIVPGPAPDTLVVAESFGYKLTAFTVAADGSLVDPRLYAQLTGVPDGIALSPEGHVWVADALTQPYHALLVADGGAVLASVPLSQQCLSVAVGGADGATLFICTTPTTVPEEALEQRGSRIEACPLPALTTT
jgi:sugar lactone lactonase YvrE